MPRRFGRRPSATAPSSASRVTTTTAGRRSSPWSRASAAQLGTAFLLAPEAGTHPVHRAMLGGDDDTALTRAFTGRLARGIVNRFMREHGRDAPSAYPEVHHLTAPLRAAAREQRDPE